MLRNTTSKGEAFKRFVAYVLGVNYPDELFCLNEIEPQAFVNIIRRRAFYVLGDAKEEERREIEELTFSEALQTDSEGWLKSHFEFGYKNNWFWRPLFCYEQKVANVRHIFLVPCSFVTQFPLSDYCWRLQL